MSAVKSWRRRSAEGRASRETVTETIDWLTPDQITTLAGLHGAPREVALAVVQLLPFGSRASFEELGLVRPDDAAAGVGHRRRLVLTELAYDVMSALAARAVADPSSVEDWTRQAEIAAALTEESREGQT